MGNPNTSVVNDALTPEEKPIIENIISLFQQLLSMQEGQNAAPPAVEEALGEEEQMNEEDVTKAVDTEDGETKAEDKLANVTPTTDTSLQDLKKSIEALTSVLTGKNKKVIKKSQDIQPVKKDQQNQVLGQIAILLQNIVQKQDAQEKLNAQLFDALGFTDDVVTKALPDKTQTVQKDKPIQTLDTTAVIKDVLTEVFKQIPAFNQNPEYRHPFNQKKDVRKNLEQIAAYIHYNK